MSRDTSTTWIHAPSASSASHSEWELGTSGPNSLPRGYRRVNLAEAPFKLEPMLSDTHQRAPALVLLVE